MLNDNYLKLINKWTGTTLDLCYEIYKKLKEEPNKSLTFKLLCESLSYIEPEDIEDKFFNRDEIYKLKKTYGKFIDESIRSTIFSTNLNNKDLESAYNSLWNIVFESNILVTDKEKSFALFWIIIDKTIPYQILGKATRMNTEEYQAICDKVSKSINKIQYIIDFPFEQRTETSSLVLDEILSMSDPDERVVLMSQALIRYSNKAMPSIQNEQNIADK